MTTTPVLYSATLSPPELFVGEHQIFDEEEQEMVWVQENLNTSFVKLQEGVESLGLVFRRVVFGEFDPRHGLLQIKDIVCEFDPTKSKVSLDDLINDEVYIKTGISCFDDSANCSVAFYFKHLKPPMKVGSIVSFHDIVFATWKEVDGLSFSNILTKQCLGGVYAKYDFGFSFSTMSTNGRIEFVGENNDINYVFGEELDDLEKPMFLVEEKAE